MKSVIVVTSLFAAILICAAPAMAQDHPALPAGAGRDVMIRVCSGCHAPDNAAQQSLDAAGWKDLVNQMADNGAKASDAEFDTITKYLTTAFPK